MNIKILIILSTIIGNSELNLALSISNLKKPVDSTSSRSSYWNNYKKNDVPKKILESIKDSPWRGGLEPATDTEDELQCQVVYGSVPSDLRGTYFRNGAGRIRIGSSLYKNWFDGDGYVMKLVFTDDEILFQGKYVRTKRFLSQQTKQEKTNTPSSLITERGAWTDSHNSNPLLNFFKPPTNPSNTNCLIPKWDKTKLLALAEGGPPIAMNPYTLQTIGVYNMKNPFHFFSDLDMFASHPVTCPKTQELFGVGFRFSLLGISMKTFRFDKEGQILKTTSFPLERYALLHDMALSENYVVFIIPPYDMSTKEMLSSFVTPPAPGLRFVWNEHEQGTRILALNRNDLSVAIDLNVVQDLSLYHVINAFEIDKKLHIHVPSHVGDRTKIEKTFQNMYFENFSNDSRCRLTSIQIDLTTQAYELLDITPPEASAFELPTINPEDITKQHRYMYTNAAFPSCEALANCIERVDLKTQEVKRALYSDEGRYAMEPCVISDHYLITLVYDSNLHVTDCVILDSLDLNVISIVRLPVFVPFGFHGIWTDEIYSLNKHSKLDI